MEKIIEKFYNNKKFHTVANMQATRDETMSYTLFKAGFLAALDYSQNNTSSDRLIQEICEEKGRFNE